MNETDHGSSSPSASAGATMFFMYTMVIITFIGLVGHLVALLIFFKPVFKKRPVTVFHINMSTAALLLSISGNTVSLVNCSKRNELDESTLVTLCRLSTGLELSGIIVYVLISLMMLGHSYFMTSYHVTSSSFYVTRRIKLTIGGLVFSWICGLLLGIPPSWMLEDFVVFENRVICQLSWVGKGWEMSYWILLVTLWICAPGLISVAAYVLTRRLIPGPPDSSTSNASLLHSQIRSNKLNIRLALSLFIPILPHFVFGLFTTIVGDHFLPTLVTLILEIISKSYVIHGPFIFLVKSRTYRAILGNILSNGPFSKVPSASNLSDGRTGTTDRHNRRAAMSRNINRSIKRSNVAPLETGGRTNTVQ